MNVDAEQQSIEQNEQQSEPTSIRDIVSSAVEEHSQKTESKDETNLEQVKHDAESKPSELPENQNSVVDPQEIEKPAEEKKYNHLSAYKKEMQEKLKELPDEIQKAIAEREQKVHRGLEKYKKEAELEKEKASAVWPLAKAVEPYIDYLEKLQLPPDQAIQKLLHYEQKLRTADPYSKHQFFIKLAQDYGIDLNAIGQMPYNAAEMEMREKLATLEQNMYKMKSNSYQSHQIEADDENLSLQIEQFRQKHAKFDELREDMAQLLQDEEAFSLEEAYAKALENRLESMARQPAPSSVNRNHGGTTPVRATSLSVRSSGRGTAAPQEPKNIHDIVRQEFERHKFN